MGRMPKPMTTIEMAAADGQTGRVTLRVTIEVRQYVREVDLRVDTASVVLQEGVSFQSQVEEGQKEVQFLVPLNIPVGDTVAVFFTAIEKKVPLQGQVFRETTTTDGNGKVQTVRELVEPLDEYCRLGLRYIFWVNGTLEMRDPYQMGRPKGNMHIETPNAHSRPY